jgi:hypothetical protein
MFGEAVSQTEDIMYAVKAVQTQQNGSHHSRNGMDVQCATIKD